MCARFEEWKNEIREYCEKNNLSFQKATQMVKSSNADSLVLQHYDPKKGKKGLLDETPMPVVLWITRGKNGPIFEQTELTQKYLAQ